MEKIQNFLAKPAHQIFGVVGKYSFLIILLLSIPAIWALFVHGFYGASDDIHIAWQYEMDAALKLGQIPPRFVPDLSFGFGYPLFNFVFPLPYYIGEIFHVFGLSFVDSVKAVFVLSVPFSMYFIYKFLKEFTSEILSLAGAIIYGFTPYRATDIFVRGAMGEILAFVFPPLIALAIVKLTSDKKLNIRWIGILGLSSAALIMSHNIMAYMFFPFLLLLAFFRIMLGNVPRLRSSLKISLALFLGLLISAYFWLPAIAESSLMKYDTVFNFSDHYPTLKQLVTPYFGYGASVPGPYDGMSFFIGTLNLLLVVVGIGALIFWRKELERDRVSIVIWAFISFFFAVFMMNFRSVFVWNALPYLPYFQFPWRFLSLATFVTPIFIVVLTKFKFANIIGILILILAIVLNFKDFRPQDFLGRTDAYFINRYIPVPVASDDYLKTGEEYLRLPKANETRPSKNYPLITSTGGTISDINSLNSLDGKFRVEGPGEMVVSYNKYLFPGWEAKVDGKNVLVTAGKPFGQISFKVPSGTHNVEVKFGETPLRAVLDLISLLSLLGAITIVLVRPKLVS